MIQGELWFDVGPVVMLEARATARRTDPHSSHAAAQRIERGAAKVQRERALYAVRNWPLSTTRELARALGGTPLAQELTHRMLGRRLPELCRTGLVRKRGLRECSVTKVLLQVWDAV